MVERGADMRCGRAGLDQEKSGETGKKLNLRAFSGFERWESREMWEMRDDGVCVGGEILKCNKA
jgi:hypothetical protein